jgi:hypothetical protein
MMIGNESYQDFRERGLVSCNLINWNGIAGFAIIPPAKLASMMEVLGLRVQQAQERLEERDNPCHTNN